ncbi:MAG: hypothetical protein FD135_1915 [Comamonadaceae bacterium]|nr:MAG: hypothetical protein FD135_1915 [Comamonadaceae bacterium]
MQPGQLGTAPIQVVRYAKQLFEEGDLRKGKGAGGAFVITRDRLEMATLRAQALAAKFNAYTAPEPFTALNELVTLLTKLRA